MAPAETPKTHVYSALVTEPVPLVSGDGIIRARDALLLQLVVWYMQNPVAAAAARRRVGAVAALFLLLPVRCLPLQLSVKGVSHAAGASSAAKTHPLTMGLVREFYEGQTVLLTGGSGFVGKVVLARLLQHCDCRKVYLLLRPLPGGTAEERLRSSVLASGVFDELRDQHGSSFDSFVAAKVEALAGDLLSADLGIRQAEAIQQEVSVVIHMAASVHFNSPLKDNYRSNVEGSLRVLDFCRRCKHLQVLVHTSTCYVNSDLRGRVKEGLIPLPWETEDVHLAVRRLIDMREQGSDDAANFEGMEKQLLGRFPNTYAFTKRLCEALITREWQLRNDEPHHGQPIKQQRSVLGGDSEPFRFPICILRPSIIGCAYKHPKRGWVDNVNATGGMLLLCALGILKCLPANPQLIGDQVPVDVVADSLIVCGAAVAASNAALINKYHSAAAAADGVAATATQAAAKHVDPNCMLCPVQVPPPFTHASVAVAASAAAPAVAPENARDLEEEAAAAAAAGRPGIYVIHSCTSDINPTYWRDLLIHGREYNMLCPYYSRLRRQLQSPYFDTDFKQFRRRFFIQQKLPGAVASSVVSSILPASSKASRGVSLLYSGLLKAEKAAEALHHFSYQEWIFEQRNLPQMQLMLSPEERSTWFLGVQDIDWREYIHYFFYGIARWLLREPSACEPPSPPLLYMDALQRYLMSTPLTPPTFSLPSPAGVQFVLAAPPLRPSPNADSIEAFVLQHPDLQPLMARLAAMRLQKRKKRGPLQQTPEEVQQEVTEEVRRMYTGMAGSIHPHAIVLLAGLFHQAFFRLFDRIIVEETHMQALKKAIQTSPGPVLLLPTHRSYMDFLLVSYVCFTYGIPLPFIAADEAFGSIAVVHRVLRRAGAFFVVRGGSKAKGERQEQVLLQKLRRLLLKFYVGCVARRYGVLEVFLEGGRSKTGEASLSFGVVFFSVLLHGLMLPPKTGILSHIAEMLLDGTSIDVTFVPMAISYDKVLEAETFPQELLGEPKKAETSRITTNSKPVQDLKDCLPNSVQGIGRLAPQAST
ncbi:NAD-binding domain 4 domain-containing protein [Cyclospora cayetanensis]|uniref:Fatty acyl-CoA reductase n=1 Tax=Cyclospora cayetanensis TaxID=88456 RepID=A0A1D3CZ86_9EIME|nr:NAD-binding domain 4 domain-containing protein [Cyclospora cayetanensis]